VPDRGGQVERAGQVLFGGVQGEAGDVADVVGVGPVASRRGEAGDVAAGAGACERGHVVVGFESLLSQGSPEEPRASEDQQAHGLIQTYGHGRR
jgi:hypothetical protein